jgi:hypothetical protein
MTTIEWFQMFSIKTIVLKEIDYCREGKRMDDRMMGFWNRLFIVCSLFYVTCRDPRNPHFYPGRARKSCRDIFNKYRILSEWRCGTAFRLVGARIVSKIDNKDQLAHLSLRRTDLARHTHRKELVFLKMTNMNWEISQGFGHDEDWHPMQKQTGFKLGRKRDSRWNKRHKSNFLTWDTKGAKVSRRSERNENEKESLLLSVSFKCVESGESQAYIRVYRSKCSKFSRRAH